MVVDTSFTNASGNQGGVPMFSRSGKQTIAEALVFQSPVKGALSTFAKQRDLEMSRKLSDVDEIALDLSDLLPGHFK